mmetsp:Transcript_26698/g.67745  ORF Transcript_26698/g.67745 Transcript_26698/m.67745 type:complete len:366 (+) Transcript_26698:235-1332(+)
MGATVRVVTLCATPRSHSCTSRPSAGGRSSEGRWKRLMSCSSSTRPSMVRSVSSSSSLRSLGTPPSAGGGSAALTAAVVLSLVGASRCGSNWSRYRKRRSTCSTELPASGSCTRSVPSTLVASPTEPPSSACTTAAPQRSCRTRRCARCCSPPAVTKRRSLYWPLSSKAAHPRDTSAANVGGAISTTSMERGSSEGSGSGSGSGARSGCSWCGSANGLGRSGSPKGLAVSDSAKALATEASVGLASSAATGSTGTSSPGGASAAPSGAGTPSFTAATLGSPGSTSGGNGSEAAPLRAESLSTSSKGLLMAAIRAMMVASSSMSGWPIMGEANGLSCGELPFGDATGEASPKGFAMSTPPDTATRC